MSELNEPRGGRGGDREEEQVRRLLERAGPRAEVPPEALADIKAAFRAEWKEHVRKRQARRFPVLTGRRLLALAASILVALGIGWWLWSSGPPAGSGPVARVERLTGVVTARSREEARLTVGAEILPETELETAEAHAALRLRNGVSLRVDAGSRVRLVSASVVELGRGAVYLDSDGGPVVTVRTPLGDVRDVGTRFEVRLLEREAVLRVRVREGEVRIEEGEESYSAAAGTELTLRAGGSVTRRQVAGHGAPWRWVLQAAPPLEIEGLTLQEVLDRVARETGWTVRYADEGLAASAGSIVVHGTIGHLTPDQALDVVLPGAGLKHQVVDGVLVIGPADGLRIPN